MPQLHGIKELSDSMIDLHSPLEFLADNLA